MDTTQTQVGGDGLAELMKEVERLERRWRHLPSRGEEGFPIGGRAVLDSLREHGSQTVPQIARRRGTSRQNIQVLVNRLKAEGWVELVQNPAHKRSELVQLTSKGREVVERMAAKEAAFLAGLSSQISPRAVSGAQVLLQRFAELLGDGGQPRQPRAHAEQPSPPAVVMPPPPPPPSGSQGLGSDGEELPVSLL